MMKFINKNWYSFFKHGRFEYSICRVSGYFTQTQHSTSAVLYQKLQRSYEQRVSVIPVLDEWVVENGQIHHQELKRFIINFRKHRRFKPALEIAEWMGRRMEHLATTPGHVALQLDLTSKVHGLEQAESYFNRLEDNSVDLRVYAALLNCYAQSKLLEKAEATMEEIRKFNSRSTLTYNVMLTLYSQMGMHGKIDSLMQEMEDKGIHINKVTYNIRLNAYAETNLERMEKLLMKMEVDPLVKVDYCSYVTAAKGYLKAGALEKALAALKKAEHLIKGQERRFAYGVLVTFYASMQRKQEVYRLWNLLQNSGKLYYGSYVYIITSLEKLDDLDGAKKILEEWEENDINFDIRIPNLVISAYCKKGHVEEAESILNRLIETGKEPSANTWSHMALGYYKNGRMEKVVEMTKKAFLATFPGWKPDFTIVAACLEYLKNKGDADGTREILMLLEKYGSFPVGHTERIGRYLSNGESRSEALESGNEITSDTRCLRVPFPSV